MAAIVYSTPENNKFFSIPIGVIRRRANLPPPAPGQPGPFSLGAKGVIEETFKKAGFRNIRSKTVSAPLRTASTAECLRLEKESFGALHQMLSSLDQAGKDSAWKEIEEQLRQFERTDGFEGPCELIIAAGSK